MIIKGDIELGSTVMVSKEEASTVGGWLIDIIWERSAMRGDTFLVSALRETTSPAMCGSGDCNTRIFIIIYWVLSSNNYSLEDIKLALGGWLNTVVAACSNWYSSSCAE